MVVVCSIETTGSAPTARRSDQQRGEWLRRELMSARDVLTGRRWPGESTTRIGLCGKEPRSAGLWHRAVVPALLPEPQFVAACPAQREAFLFEKLRHDHIA